MEPDSRWEMFGVTQQRLEEQAEWMSRDPGWPAPILYFKTAGSLLRFAWYDYYLSGLALFQAIAGFEGMLRTRYIPNFNTTSPPRVTPEATLEKLIEKAISDRVLTDSVFRNPKPFPADLMKRIKSPRKNFTCTLMDLIRALRNDYFHGQYFLSPICVELAIHMREAADAVMDRRP